MERVQALNIDVLTGTVNPVPKVTDAGDANLWVTFESASHFDDVATRQEGRPVFQMKDYVKIVIPGDSTQVIHRPIRETDKERWPQQWLAYQTGKTQEVGYPLTEWAGLSRAQVDELSYFKINTVEQLANVSDLNCQKFAGLVGLRDKAKAYLEQLRGEAPLNRILAEKAMQEEKNKALEAQLAELREAVAELTRKRSKKGKSEDEAEAA